MKINKLLACLGLSVVCFTAASPVYAAVAGHVQFVNGDVQVTNTAGQSRPAQKGDAINEGDTLTSAQKSSAQIKMQDGGFVAVREDTRLKFDQFVFAGKEDGSEKSFFSLFKGGFRAVTGLIGRINKQNYRVTTPAATIGIRGTDHETFMIAPGSPLAQVAPTGAYNKVNVGETSMTTDKGTIFVQPNQMGFAGGMNQMPQVQPINTNIFTVAEAPTPGAKAEKKEEKEEKAGAKQEEKAAEGAKEGKKEEAKAETAAEGGEEAPVRETAVVDAAAPSTGAPAATTTTAVATAAVEVIAPPTVLQTQTVTTFTAGGTTLNVVAGTGTTAGGQVIIPGVVAPPTLATCTAAPATAGCAAVLPTVATCAAAPATAGCTAVLLPPAAGTYAYEVVATGGTAGAYTILNPFSGDLPATSYLFDSTNNLVRVNTAFGGADYFTGGTAMDTWKSADGSIYMGRWQGGSLTMVDSLGTVSNNALGAGSAHWIVSLQTPLNYVQTLGGTATYTLAMATAPTDALGNAGTLLNTSTITANFTSQLVDMALNIQFTGARTSTFAVTTPGGIPIFSDTIWGGGTVTCTGANCDAAGYSANLWGRFSGATATNAALAYHIIAGTTDLIQGAAAFSTATAPTPVAITTAPYVQSDSAMALVTNSSSSASNFVQIGTLIANPVDINNALPNPSFTDRFAGKDTASYVTYTLNGTTTVGQATTTLGNGIQFGRWDSTSAQWVAVGNTNCCAPLPSPSGTPVYSHWIGGPAVNPVYLPEVLLGTATYTIAGGTTPTVTTAATGYTAPALNMNSASTNLSVNFTQQLVTFNLALTGIPWTASATAPLQMMYWNGGKTGFRASTNFAVMTGWAPLTVTGATTGDIVGQLTGNGLDGAIMSYVLNGQVSAAAAQVSGVAAFTGTAQNTATPYRIAALSTIDTIPAGQTNAGLTVPTERGGYNNATNVQFDGAGNAIQFNADKPFSNGSANTINIGTATPVGLGTDPVSGISWGRWQGGNLAITDLATNTTANPANTNSHWITGPTMTGPVDLPVSGTYNYVLAGGTAPTDSLGGVGTLNSASLTANFTAQTVAVSLNVTTPNAGNLVAVGAGIPIEQKSFFNAGTANAPNGGTNLGSLTIACPAGCPAAVLSGHLGGVFVGAGGIGAGVAYGMQKDAVIVNGVAAFHR